MPTIWRVWFGGSTLRPLQAAAIDSCHIGSEFRTVLVHDAKTLKADFPGTIVDATSLGIPLHRAFHLLDPVQKADYIRAELLHHFGGFYLDTDVFCLRGLKQAYEASAQFDASGATLRAAYYNKHHNPTAMLIESNALGPFRANTTYTRSWRDSLLRRMDASVNKLEKCQGKYPDGSGGIAYIGYPRAGRNKCGFEWGAFVNFKRRIDNNFEARGYFGRALQLCDGLGRMLGLASSETELTNSTATASTLGNFATCDLFHVGTAAAWENPPSIQHLSRERMCKRWPVLRQSPRLRCRQQPAHQQE